MTEKIESLISRKGSYKVKILVIIFSLFPLLLCKYFKINVVLITYLIIIFTLLFAYNQTHIEAAKKISLSQFEKVAQTGDIVLFKTNVSYDIPEFIFFRVLLTLIDKNKWSHVGIVIRSSETGKLYVWEASEDLTYDHMTRADISGIKLSELHDKITNYHGIVGYRKLKVPLKYDTKKLLEKICYQYRGTPFKKNLVRTPGELNCAESIELLLKHANIYRRPKSFLPVTPGDFSSKKRNGTNLIWDNDCIISPK